MNLVDGKILDTKDCDAVLDMLNDRILATLTKPRLKPDIVIQACNQLVFTLDGFLYDPAIKELGLSDVLARRYIDEVRTLFSGDALRYRLQKEFGGQYDRVFTSTPMAENYTVKEQWLPLGVLLHVAAGNADGLAAFSVLEGLLTGNINILKLPAAEGGLSVRLLSELIGIEPLLAEYIYVFDYSSKDITHLNKLIKAADGVVVWGGVEAVSAFRRLIPPNIKLIEWGHKISFAYVAKNGVDDDKLSGLMFNIASTGQILCSSCQGIYIDTEDFEDVCAFCERFLPVLEGAVAKYAGDRGVGIKTQAALQRYTAQLETALNGNRVFGGKGCSLIACKDQILEPAMGINNIWVKALSQSRLLKTLRPYKSYLQTTALICGHQEEAGLSDLLFKSGVVRICSGERMSAAYPGAPHDGEYPLRRYMKVTAVEKQ